MQEDTVLTWTPTGRRPCVGTNDHATVVTGIPADHTPYGPLSDGGGAGCIVTWGSAFDVAADVSDSVDDLRKAAFRARRWEVVHLGIGVVALVLCGVVALLPALCALAPPFPSNAGWVFESCSGRVPQREPGALVWGATGACVAWLLAGVRAARCAEQVDALQFRLGRALSTHCVAVVRAPGLYTPQVRAALLSDPAVSQEVCDALEAREEGEPVAVSPRGAAVLAQMRPRGQ